MEALDSAACLYMNEKERETSQQTCPTQHTTCLSHFVSCSQVPTLLFPFSRSCFLPCWHVVQDLPSLPSRICHKNKAKATQTTGRKRILTTHNSSLNTNKVFALFKLRRCTSPSHLDLSTFRFAFFRCGWDELLLGVDNKGQGKERVYVMDQSGLQSKIQQHIGRTKWLRLNRFGLFFSETSPDTTAAFCPRRMHCTWTCSSYSIQLSSYPAIQAIQLVRHLSSGAHPPITKDGWKKGYVCFATWHGWYSFAALRACCATEAVRGKV